jgi:hypothetical protein
LPHFDTISLTIQLTRWPQQKMTCAALCCAGHEVCKTGEVLKNYVAERKAGGVVHLDLEIDRTVEIEIDAHQYAFSSGNAGETDHFGVGIQSPKVEPVFADRKIAYDIPDANAHAGIGSGCEEELIDASAAKHNVSSGTAPDAVIAIVAVDRIVTLTAEKEIVTHSAAKDVVAGASGDPVVVITAKEHVVANAAVQQIRASTAKQLVVTRAAKQPVITHAAVELVIAGAAVKHVIAVTAEQAVITGVAVEFVIPGLAPDKVIAPHGPNDIVIGCPVDAVIIIGRSICHELPLFENMHSPKYDELFTPI